MEEKNEQELNPIDDSYNDVPVYYCKSCKSLKIRIADSFDYCDDCGSTEIGSCHINEWLNMNK